jgi:ATP-dependent helicase/nuclease subunit A
MLLGYAENFEKTSFKGLFHFVRYIEHMRVSMVDYGEAGIIDETDDVVRIMSIHKSKGLEFPVVFVSGLSKKFNRMDTTGDVILDMDLGIGVKHIDSALRVRYDTLKRRIISDKMELDSLGEEIRVLYVALTRAKEKLILTAAVDDLSKELTKALRKLSLMRAGSSLLPYSARSRAGSFFDLILPAVIKHPSIRPLLEKCECAMDEYDIYSDKGDVPALTICSISDIDLESGMVEMGAKGILRGEDLIRNLETDYDKDLFERLRARFTAIYPHENLRGLFTKTTVSELKKARIKETFGEVHDEGDRNLDREDGLRKAGDDSDLMEAEWFEEGETVKSTPRLKGAERGTAYHRVMELLDDGIYGDESFMEEAVRAEKSDQPGPASKKIYAWLKGKEAEGKISPEAADAVWTPDISKFLATDIGQRMGRAFRRGDLRREQPFMMGVRANELDPGFPEEEMVLVQGIIDAFFVEDGEIVLLDYKTDRVKDENTLTDLYKVQLELYNRAIEASTGMKVKESLIYSFALARQIRLD